MFFCPQPYPLPLTPLSNLSYFKMFNKPDQLSPGPADTAILEHGGLRERMSKARLQIRGKQEYNGKS
jgi:hypothetical protein